MHIGSWPEWEVAERTEPEVVATVSINSFSEPYGQPDPKGVDVRLKEGRSQKQPSGVDEYVFQRVCVFHGPAVGLLVLVVQLVDVLVQEGSVECSVEPVEAEVFYQQKQRHLDCHLLPNGTESFKCIKCHD